jgi:hypothetical protein
MNSRRVVLCLGALLSALLAFAPGAVAAKKKTPAPEIKSISPLALKVGEKLTVKGKNFLPGKNKTRVFFVRRGGGTAFARAEKATRTKLVVTLPAQLDKVLGGKAARVQIRVLGKKFGKLSVAKKSPIVSPAPAGIDPGTDPNNAGPAGAAGDCDKDGVPNSAETDKDNDLLSDAQETALGLDACNADTDGDGVQDGYEYQSALDLNRTTLFGSPDSTPYPAKRPYPNPLFADEGVDYDSDGLSLGQEYLLWAKYGGHTLDLNYSDGKQTTVQTPAPTDPILQQLDTASGWDHYGDGWLDDAERDADGDGLANWDEANGRMTQVWWNQTYEKEPKERAYPDRVYSGVDMTDPDTDGDGVPDGADDEDHDGLSNAFEVARPWNWAITYVSTSYDGTDNGSSPYPANPYARVNPFNPCKPVYSDLCHRHIPFGYYEDEDWAGLTPTQAGPPDVTPGPLWP